jgi:hypothetical protein
MSAKTLSVEDAVRLRLTAYYLCGAECDLPDGGVHWTRPATREDILAAVRELGAVEVEVAEVNASYGRAPKVVSSDHAFVDMDHEIGTDLLPGRYLIVPLDTGDTDGT